MAFGPNFAGADTGIQWAELCWKYFFCYLTLAGKRKVRLILPARLYLVQWSHWHTPVLGAKTWPHRSLVKNTGSIGMTGWVKKQRLLSKTILQSICYLGKLKLLSGVLFLLIRTCYQSESLLFRAGFPAAAESRAQLLTEESFGGGALAWGPWVQRVISASPARKHCSWMTAAGCRQHRQEFVLESQSQWWSWFAFILLQTIYIWKYKWYVRTLELFCQYSCFPFWGLRAVWLLS